MVREEDTPRANTVTVRSDAGVRTTQATLVSVIVFGFILGGGLVSIKRDISDQARDMGLLREEVKILKEAVFYSPSKKGTP